MSEHAWHIHHSFGQQMSLSGNVIRSSEPVYNNNIQSKSVPVRSSGMIRLKGTGAEIIEKKAQKKDWQGENIVKQRISGLFDSNLPKEVLFKPVAGEKQNIERILALEMERERKLQRLFKIGTSKKAILKTRVGSVNNTKKMIQNKVGELSLRDSQGERLKIQPGSIGYKENVKTKNMRELREKEKQVVNAFYNAIEHQEGNVDVEMLKSSIKSIARYTALEEMKENNTNGITSSSSSGRINNNINMFEHFIDDNRNFDNKDLLPIVESRILSNKSNFNNNPTSIALAFAEKMKMKSNGQSSEPVINVKEIDKAPEKKINQSEAEHNIVNNETKLGFVHENKHSDGNVKEELKQEIKDIVVNAMQNFFNNFSLNNHVIENKQILTAAKEVGIPSNNIINNNKTREELSLDGVYSNLHNDSEDRDFRFKDAQREIDDMEETVNKIELKLKGEEDAGFLTAEKILSENVFNVATKGEGDKILFKQKVKTISRDVMLNIREYRNEYEKKRVIAEATLQGTFESQASLMIVIGNSIIDDLITSIGEEIESNLDSYAEFLFKSL